VAKRKSLVMDKYDNLPLGLVDNVAERQFVYRRNKGDKRVYQGFSYRGDKQRESVRRKAIAFAHKTNKQLGPVARTPVGKMTVRNSSGVVGVAISKNCVKGVEYWSWVARWPEQPSGVRFSIDRHGGEDQSFLYACIARELRVTDREEIKKIYKRWLKDGTAKKYLKKKGVKLVDA